jgi:flagella basal body P-ring formation protein FlgA
VRTVLRTALALLLALGGLAGPARADEALPGALAEQLQRWTLARADEAGPQAGARIEVELGRLDPRLRLAPCGRIEPYLPTGSRPWGRTRVGLRCTDGAARWNVFLPVTVRVWAPAPVLREPLPAGTELREDHLTEGEVDWAERSDAPIADPVALLGHSLARPVSAGDALRQGDLRRREWFAAGDRVRVWAVGPGYRVSTEGQALSRGVDGRTVRVRTEAGRVITGVAVAERQVEIAL